MKTRSIVVKQVLWSLMAAVAVLVSQAAGQDAKPAGGAPAAAAAHRVAAVYFHRTVRCPTCRTISAYIEESVQAGFAAQIKKGSVSVSMIDFQNEKNQKYTDYYQIAGPTLVLVDVRDGKAAAWKKAPKVWTLVRDKDAFFKYVQDEVRAYLESK